MAEFGVTHVRDTPAIALSGGERRRVEIARALATHPSYILLDEPLAGIDPIAVSDIRDLVKHLKDRGIGVLITDHNVRDALDIIDRAYIIHEGQVLKEGLPAEIVGDRDVRRVYLGERFSLYRGWMRRTVMAIDTTAGDSPGPVPGHDAAIAAGDQAAAIVESRTRRICRRGAGAQSASGARRARAGAERARRPKLRNPPKAKRSTPRSRAKISPRPRTWMPGATMSMPRSDLRAAPQTPAARPTGRRSLIRARA